MSGISVEWAESQHFNFLMSLIGEINTTEDDGKRPLSNAEIMKNMV